MEKDNDVSLFRSKVSEMSTTLDSILEKKSFKTSQVCSIL